MAERESTPELGAPVSLREISRESLRKICGLSDTLEPPQSEAVAPNVDSIAEASFSSSAWPRAVYAAEIPVGFVMLNDQPEIPKYFLWRFMIAAPHQGKGFGRQAIAQLIDYVKTRPGADTLLVSCVEGEGSPEGFYVTVGFKRTGEKHGSEIELVRDLHADDPDYTTLKADTPANTQDRIREYFDRLINKRDLSVCRERLSLGYIDHGASTRTLPGPQATIDYMEQYLTDHPVLSVQIEDLLLDSSKAALRMTWQGTDTSGVSFTKTGNVILHLNGDDQIIERWSSYE